MVLNSVKILDDYGLKSGQTQHRALLVEDSTKKTILKLWGASSNTAYPKNSIITIQAVGEGNLSANEWPAGSGKFSINANDCEVRLESGSPAAAAPDTSAPPQAPPPTSQAASSAHRALTPEQLADAQAAHFARVFTRIQGAATDAGADPSSITMAAAHMTGSASDWWFGEKYPGCKTL